MILTIPTCIQAKMETEKLEFQLIFPQVHLIPYMQLFCKAALWLMT